MQTRDFNREAANWDEQPGRTQLANDLFAALEREIQLTPAMEVFEFGCGTGLITMRLQPHVGRIVGVDSSSGMLAELEKKVEASGAGNVETRLVDLAKGDRLEGQFDLVVISMVLHHIRVVAEILAKFHEILRPGGRLAILDLDCEDGSFHTDPVGVFHLGFDREELGRYMAEAGFSEVAFSHASDYLKKRGDREATYTVFLAVGRKPSN